MAPMKRSSSTFQVAKATYLTEAALLRFSQVQHFLSQSGRCPFMAFASYAYIFSIHEEQIAPYTGQAVAQSERATGEPDVCRQSLLTVCFIWLDVLITRASARTKWQMANLKVAITCDQSTVVKDRLDSTLSCSHLITGS
jgi:hypothetical protein